MATAGRQQLVTGASVLVVCFTTHDSITQYHFAIGTTLAFASFSTFLNIVIVSGDVLRASRLKKAWRFSWVFFLAVAITLSTFVFEDQNFLVPDQWGTSMQCVWDILGTYDGASKIRLVIWTVFAADGLLCTAGFLWPESPFANWYDVVRFVPARALLRAVSWVDKTFLRSTQARPWRAVGLVLRIPLLCTFWVVFAVFEILCSVSYDIFRTFLILFLTTWGLYQFRSTAREYLTESEDTWGFGQILPMLLLALPAFTALELAFSSTPCPLAN